MIYTVIWTPVAEHRLAAIWLATSDRAAVTEATAAIDQSLSIDPEQQGLPVFDTVRRLVHDPLGVEFEVIDADRLVKVLAAWRV